MLVRFLACLLSFGVVIAHGDAHAAVLRLRPADEAKQLRDAEELGHAIYLHDHAASVATDAALELPSFQDNARVKGWITQAVAGRLIVTFFDATPAALYRVAVAPDGNAGAVEAFASPLPLTRFEAGAVAARNAALASNFDRCSAALNSVVLPAPDGQSGRWWVYVLPATTTNDAIPLGGAHRIEIQDGKIASQRGFAASCVKIRNGPPDGAAGVTSIMDAVPTELHVFVQLLSGRTLFVSTAGSVWRIDGGRITRISRNGTKP